MSTLRFDDVPSYFKTLRWFFPNLDGCVHAEKLLNNNAKVGEYLLRISTSNHGMYSISVKTESGVKHFPITVKDQLITFGIVTFKSFDDFLDHFNNQPIVSDNDGNMILLKHPFISSSHLTVFECSNVHGTLYNEESLRFSKAGYLTKQGGVVKTWKERWFVLAQNKLLYYEKEDCLSLKGKIDLRDCVGTHKFSLPHVNPGKEFAFEVILPWRTYLIVSNSSKNRDEWVNVINETLGWIKNHK